MEVQIILQLIIAVGLINVWIIRHSKSTPYRGGYSQNLKEEFKAYGLPSWMYYLVGTLKLGAAFVLIGTLFFHWPMAVKIASGVVSLLMLGALAMHFKIKDPLLKSLPAFFMLLASAALFFLS